MQGLVNLAGPEQQNLILDVARTGGVALWSGKESAETVGQVLT